jgi:tripartite-type tricarboxylate transporter receptor subunit TctC
VSVASYSPGTLSHVLGLQLNQAAGIDLLHVGYKGSTPGLTDVMGGHVPLMFDGIPTSLPLIRSGKLKAFAVSTPKRSPVLPDVPTFTELGYPKLEALAWMGLWCPPDVPAPVQMRVREAALKALAQPAVKERLREIGFDVGLPRTSDEMVAGLRADYERVGAVLKGIGFKPE